MQLQEFMKQLGEILRLVPDANFCISKNMALFFYVFRMKLCFCKCKFIELEARLEFHPRQLRLQDQVFFTNPPFLHHLSSFSLHLSGISINFYAKISLIKINKIIFSSKNCYWMIFKIVKKMCWLNKFCLRLHCDIKELMIV